MTERVFTSATSRRGAARADVGGNVSKLQLNPHQLVSQGRDSQAKTPWRDGDGAPAALASCRGAGGATGPACGTRCAGGLPGAWGTAGLSLRQGLHQHLRQQEASITSGSPP